MTRIVLHVDRLVLKGIAREDRHAFVERLRQELARRLAEPDTAGRLARRSGTPRVEAGPVSIPPGPGVGRLAARTARAIAREITS